MKEEVISSSGHPLLPPKSSSPPPTPTPNPTPAASSAGASSPAVPVNVGSIDWLGHGQGSKAGSLSRIGSQPLWTSLSTSAGGSALGSSQPSCRPWERADLLRRLSTFKPANWFGKSKATSSFLHRSREEIVEFLMYTLAAALTGGVATAGYKAVLHMHAVVEECEIVELMQQIDRKTKRRILNVVLSCAALQGQ